MRLSALRMDPHSRECSSGVISQLVSSLSPGQTQEQHEQLVAQLRSFLWGPQSSFQASLEVLEYFFDKLTLSHLTPRSLALKVGLLCTFFF